MRLQLDWTNRQQGLAFGKVIMQPCLIDHGLVVEHDRHGVADNRDLEVVPFADRLIRQQQRVLARSVGWVIP